jgi:hypothetical protein
MNQQVDGEEVDGSSPSEDSAKSPRLLPEIIKWD